MQQLIRQSEAVRIDSMLKAGVIGTGYLGQHHARILSELEGVDLTAVVDIEGTRAAAIGDKYGAPAYTDFRKALDKADAFCIVTPTITHYEIARECLRAGKDILIEKPITESVAEADDLEEIALQGGVIIQVGHLERFNPAVIALYPLIQGPRFFEAERLSPYLGRGTDVDITLDLMIHDIDIVLAILSHEGKSTAIRDTKAAVARVLTDKIDMAKVWIEFDNGAQALMTASRLSHEKSRKLKIFQKESFLLVDYQGMEIQKYYRQGSAIEQESVQVEKREPLREELKDFVKCVTTRRTPVVSAREGREALRIALLIGNKMGRRVEA